MANTLEIAADSSCDHELLLEFLHLLPVGIMKFRPTGRIEMANPAAIQLLMPLVTDADLSNLYTVFSGVLSDLRTRVERFQAPCGHVCDQMQFGITPPSWTP